MSTHRKLLQSLVLSSPLVLAACAGGGDNFAQDGGSGEAPKTPHELGIYHFSAGQYGLAVTQFRKAMKANPNSVESLNGLGAAYDRLGRYDLAENNYRRALAIDPSSPQTLNNLGYSYMLQGRYDLAYSYLESADQVAGGDPVVQVNRDKAEKALEKSLQNGTLAQGNSYRTAPAAQGQLAESEIATMWVERTSPAVQTLITKPSAEFVSAISTSGVSPETVSYQEKSVREPISIASRQVAEVPGLHEVDEGLARGEGGLSGEPVAEVRTAAPLSQSTLNILNDLPDVVPQVAAVVPVEQAEIEEWQPAKVDVLAGADPIADDLSDLGAGMPVQIAAADAGPAEQPLEVVAEEPRVINQVQLAAAELMEPAAEEGISSAGQIAALPPGPLQTKETISPDAEPIAVPVQAALQTSEEPRIEVSNGAGRRHMAKRMKGYLETRGLRIDRLTNARHFAHMQSTIYFREEWRVFAMGLAATLPVQVRLVPVRDQDSDLRVELGGDLLDFDRDLLYGHQRVASLSAE